MSIATDTAAGAAQGAAAGSVAGPWGAVAGGVIGGIGGFLGGKSKNKAKKRRRRALAAQRRAAAAQAAITGLQAKRARTEVIRSAMREEARQRSQAVASGQQATGTSASQFDIATQLATELGYEAVVQQLNTRAGGFMQYSARQLDKANRDLERAAEIGAITSGLTSAIGTFGGMKSPSTTNQNAIPDTSNPSYNFSSNQGGTTNVTSRPSIFNQN